MAISRHVFLVFYYKNLLRTIALATQMSLLVQAFHLSSLISPHISTADKIINRYDILGCQQSHRGLVNCQQHYVQTTQYKTLFYVSPPKFRPAVYPPHSACIIIYHSQSPETSRNQARESSSRGAQGLVRPETELRDSSNYDPQDLDNTTTCLVSTASDSRGLANAKRELEDTVVESPHKLQRSISYVLRRIPSTPRTTVIGMSGDVAGGSNTGGRYRIQLGYNAQN
ncbi:hypothetical protein K440DRAFT_638907 [Wilcoxina mikolae CBS 423.85]|nr:hypothetical protein K440DRAFT_638907 [Wilcoxina mikolae CBS 423.85]